MVLRTPIVKSNRTPASTDTAVEGARLARMMGIVGVGPLVKGYSMSSKHVSTLQELYDGDLAQLLQSGTVSKSNLESIAVQLKYLICTVADLGYVLMDIKLGNIVVRRNAEGLTLKLIDFDLDFVSSFTDDKEIIQKIKKVINQPRTSLSCNVLRLLYVLIMHGLLIHYLRLPRNNTYPSYYQLSRLMSVDFRNVAFPFYMIPYVLKKQRLRTLLISQIKHYKLYELPSGSTGITRFFALYQDLTFCDVQDVTTPLELKFSSVNYSDNNMSAAHSNHSRLFVTSAHMRLCEMRPLSFGQVVNPPQSLGVALPKTIPNNFNNNDEADDRDSKTRSHWNKYNRYLIQKEDDRILQQKMKIMMQKNKG